MACALRSSVLLMSYHLSHSPDSQLWEAELAAVLTGVLPGPPSHAQLTLRVLAIPELQYKSVKRVIMESTREVVLRSKGSV